MAKTLTPAAPADTDTTADTLPTGHLVVIGVTKPDVAALATALATVDAASATDSAAHGVLAETVREHYAYHAARYARTVDGVSVLPDNKRKDVATMLWLAATESPSPVPMAERTPGETSLGQYISRYAKVATDLGYGIAGIADVAGAKAAYKAILSGNKAAKDNLDAAAAALAEQAEVVAFKEWLTTQTAELQEAYKLVRHSLRTDGAPHMSAFVADSTI